MQQDMQISLCQTMICKSQHIHSCLVHLYIITGLTFLYFTSLLNCQKGIFLTLCYHHVMYKFQSESSLYSLPECQETPCSKQAPCLEFK